MSNVDIALKHLSRNGAGSMIVKILAPICLLMSIAFGYLAGLRAGFATLIFCAFMIVFAAGIVQLTFIWPMHVRFRNALRDPSKIVWIYEEQRAGTRSGSHHWLVLAMLDGKRVELQTTFLDRAFAQKLFDEVAATAPRATRGQSPQRAQVFASNPSSLLANT